MRICPQCKKEMTEGLAIKVEGAGYGIKIAKNDNIFAKRMIKPKVAVCLECGELSLYVDDIEKIKDKL